MMDTRLVDCAAKKGIRSPLDEIDRERRGKREERVIVSRDGGWLREGVTLVEKKSSTDLPFGVKK